MAGFSSGVVSVLISGLGSGALFCGLFIKNMLLKFNTIYKIVHTNM